MSPVVTALETADCLTRGGVHPDDPDQFSVVLGCSLDAALSPLGRAADERQPVCSSSYRTVVLYTYLQGASNDLEKHREAILRQVKNDNYRLDQEGLLSGDKHADMYTRCDGNGEIWIGSFPTSTNNPTLSQVRNSAIAAGFNSSTEKYLIYADFVGACRCAGHTTSRNDSSPAENNLNNVGPTWAVAYHWPSDLHEWLHIVGAVQVDAPNATPARHCTDGLDVMCYDDGSAGATQRLVCPERIWIDCNHDDYFDTRPEPGEYLSDHWNVGTAARWLRFIDAPRAPHNLRVEAGIPRYTASWDPPSGDMSITGYRVYGCRLIINSGFQAKPCEPLWPVGSDTTTTSKQIYLFDRAALSCLAVAALSGPNNEGAKSEVVCVGGLTPTTSLTYTGDTRGQTTDEATLSARLESADGPVAGKTVAFSLDGDPAGSATTDEEGVASLTTTLNGPGRSTQVTADFEGDEGFAASSTTSSFEVERENSSLTLDMTRDRDTTTATALLTDPDSGTGIDGRTIRFIINGSESKTATTDTSGVATASLHASELRAGDEVVAIFDGDGMFLGSEATKEAPSQDGTGPGCGGKSCV